MVPLVCGVIGSAAELASVSAPLLVLTTYTTAEVEVSLAVLLL